MSDDKIPMIDDRCGTAAGYQAHRKRGEASCGPCRVANTDYVRGLRKRRPDLYADEKRRSKARTRATWRLVELHRDEWRKLVLEELAELPPCKPDADIAPRSPRSARDGSERAEGRQVPGSRDDGSEGRVAG